MEIESLLNPSGSVLNFRSEIVRNNFAAVGEPPRSFNVARVKDIRVLLESGPIAESRGSLVVLDIDGVLINPFNGRRNLDNLKTAGRFIERASKVIFSTSRKQPDDNDLVWQRFGKNDLAITRYPYISLESQENLERFVKRCNSRCEVDFVVGRNKLRYGDEMIKGSVVTALKQNKNVVIVGSNWVDRGIVRRLATGVDMCGGDTSRIFYVDTGHWLI
ncbi:MAG: hypothetical protein KIH89_002120 [Candidatus Shapirobacteria bacterium]|nr:hypothetical protein [Candidatus Shapirobacteria bacterium]